MNVSVIITTKNEEKNIVNCLESVIKQDYPEESIEILVIDNNSADKTKDAALKYTKKIYDHGPERSAQRNFGVKQASGKYILYLDADMILSPCVVKECVDKCEREGLIALYIPEIITGKGFWIKVRDFERSFYNATLIDCVRFVRKDKFLEIGGFDENLTGPEDWDFDRRMRQLGNADIINSPIYHNEGKIHFKKYLDKKSYYCKSFDAYIKKWGQDDSTVKKQLGSWYRLFGVFIEGGKWKKLVRHPILAIGMFILRFMLGIMYCVKRNI
jgi:glycosyltransferase involved in cell wall biosynthesis